ncbi:MAG: polysaccharide deacetylase family protein [Spirochaetales bacterium]|nr:polysaccharide deacetylase family protein [Spirochaetales bacterium]
MNFFKKSVILILGLISLGFLYGETQFSRPDLGDDSTLLFFAERDESYRKGNYATLLRTNLDTGDLQLLTHYPEEHYFTSRSKELFLWNRYGLYTFTTPMELPKRVDIYPSLEQGSPIQLGKLSPLSISPDGRYFLYYRQSDWSRGDLLLFDRDRGYSTLVTSGITMDYEGDNIRWSGDSAFFAYVKQGSLYYISLEKLIEGRLPEEEIRRLGAGGPGSFKWGNDNSLYFVNGKEILSVRANEMFALSFYDSPLQIGTVAGHLFFDFNPNFDEFWISPDRNHLLVKREEGALFLMDLEFRNFNNYGEIKRFPFLKLPAGQVVRKVIWAESGKMFALVGGELDRDLSNSLYVYDPSQSLDSFSESRQSGVIDLALSPDGESLALLYNTEITIRDTERWTLLRSASTGVNNSCYWADDSRIIVLGDDQSTLYDVKEDESRLLFFSQCDDFGFSLEGQIQISSLGKNYVLNKGKWENTEEIYFREKKVYNEDFRVFLTENHHPVLYSNLVMVRSVKEFGTEPLLKDLEQSPISEGFKENPGSSSSIFNHGSRIKRKEVSLVFNVNSGITGLMDVLNVLAEYGIEATFFINGDSIRKYPRAIKALSGTDHEMGSLFYTQLDMTDRKYNIDKDFIIRGLARNEDEYFRATGKEILPLWHAPWYFVNTDIVEASEEMNYTYIGRDVETLDWVDRNDDFLYYGADDIINRIGEQIEPGSIIPITIGSSADREDYLFQKLELLLNGLIKEGYQIVPVGLMMEHNK